MSTFATQKHKTMKHILILLIIIPILASSCATIGRYESGISYSNNYLLISPIFDAGVIERANSLRYDSTLSSMAEKTIMETAFNHSSIMQFSDTATAPEHLKLQIARLANIVATAKTQAISGMTTPQDIDDFIAEHGYRYGMVIFGTGFVRPVGNTIGWMSLAVFTGVLTGVSVYPNMNNLCKVDAIVIDAYEHRIISVKTSGPHDRNPSKREVVEQTFLKTLKIRR